MTRTIDRALLRAGFLPEELCPIRHRQLLYLANMAMASVTFGILGLAAVEFARALVS